MNGNNTLIPFPAGHIGTNDQADFGSAAVELYESGWIPIPLLPKSKRPAVKWGPWQQNLSARTIRQYWKQRPDHELAVILGPDTIVFDADTTEGVIELYLTWESFEIKPNLIVETDRGEHHYFRLSRGTFAKSDAPDKADHPGRVDIKTGNAIAAVPPSSGKRYSIKDATGVDDLVEIGQNIVDAIYRHNGRDAPRKPPDDAGKTPKAPLDQEQLVADIQNLLQHIDPDCGYDAWVRVGMAIHHEFDGSDVGCDLYDAWSSRGGKYLGRPALEMKWRSFAGHTGTPVTLGTIRKLAADNGATWDPLPDEAFPIIEGDGQPEQVEQPGHCLLPYSLQGMSSELEAELLAHCFILLGIAILGQWTVIYAPPNSGKTLLVLWLIIQGILRGDIRPEHLFYVNADDNLQGLASKLRLAETHGFHMLTPGYQDFRVKHFLTLIRKLCDTGQARGAVIILDTLKKFTDLLDKRTASDFGSAIREFIAKGGTLIGLAHVNKKRGPDGKPVYAGTTDIVDDADCAFVLDIISDEGDVRTVEFENIKSRGMVARKAAYCYSTAEGQSYSDLLASVCPVDESQAEVLREAAAAFDEKDYALVQVTQTCINDGITAKTQLIAAVVNRSGASRRQVERVIDKFTGDDPHEYHWNFTRGARGLTTFELLPEPDDIDDIVDLADPDSQEVD